MELGFPVQTCFFHQTISRGVQYPPPQQELLAAIQTAYIATLPPVTVQYYCLGIGGSFLAQEMQQLHVCFNRLC